jgi:transcriptional regulator with XRE-family HTH domain
MTARTVQEPCPCCQRWNGAFLREMRERAGKSLRQIARDAGVSAAYVSDVERNRRNPNVTLLQAYRATEYIQVGERTTEDE